MTYSDDPTPVRTPPDDEFLGVAVMCLVVGCLLGISFAGLLQSPSPLEPSGATPSTSLSRAKDFLATIQSSVTVGAIVAGGLWFYRRRARYPRMIWEHVITHQRLNEHTIWLHVQIRVENKGEVYVEIPHGITRVHLVLPAHPTLPNPLRPSDRSLFEGGEICWPMIAESKESSGVLDVEPAEITTFERDFLIPAQAEVLVVYTFIPNRARANTGHGWPIQTLYRIAAPTRDGGSENAGEQG